MCSYRSRVTKRLAPSHQESGEDDRGEERSGQRIPLRRRQHQPHDNQGRQRSQEESPDETTEAREIGHSASGGCSEDDERSAADARGLEITVEVPSTQAPDPSALVASGVFRGVEALERLEALLENVDLAPAPTDRVAREIP